MENTATKKLGFACKWLDDPTETVDMKINARNREINTSTTTVAWLNRQTREVAEQRLWDLMIHNITAARLLVSAVAKLPESQRMVRLGSDILPVYTEASWSYFWQKTDVKRYAEQEFIKVGNAAREAGVRLSMHPGQFCCIVSDKADVVSRSISELEYHADMARWMGYGKSKLDFKINVHLSGRVGATGFDAAWTKMSTELRNCLTIENDEYQAGIDDVLKVADKAGIVLDIHHHLMHSGEYISNTDDRIKKIIESWQDVRPVIHYSQSKEEYLSRVSSHLPTFVELTTIAKTNKLRAHSDFYNHVPTNNWASTHWEWADIMCESKAKNLATRQLFEEWH